MNFSLPSLERVIDVGLYAALWTGTVAGLAGGAVLLSHDLAAIGVGSMILTAIWKAVAEPLQSDGDDLRHRLEAIRALNEHDDITDASAMVWGDEA